MFDHIVLLTDLSESTRLAFPPLCAFAREFRSKVTIFHAFRGSSELFSLSGDAAQMRSVIDEADRQRVLPPLRAWATELAAAGLEVAIETRVGSTFDLAIDVVVELRADLAVVATQGLQEFTGRILGSPTARLLRDSKVPVMSVNEQFGERAPQFEACRRIVHPIDFSGPWQHTMGAAEAVAVELGGRVDVVDVIAPVHAQKLETPEGEILLPKDLQYTLRSKMQARLSDAAHTISKVPAYWQLIEDNKPGSAVMAYADRCKADLIVIHAIGRDHVRNTLLGSVAEHVVKHARCPVLSIPDSWPIE
ncbi:MAG: universal stress protein [Deltaproteobacteria bacterium]|nr:universal stress protein [Deltaproteobacteria bacterium]